MNLLLVLTQKRDDFTENMVSPLVFMVLLDWNISQDFNCSVQS